MRKTNFSWAFISLLAFSAAATGVYQEQGQKSPESKPLNAATFPVPRNDEPAWKARHEAMNEQAKKGEAELVFIGDSITQGWEGAGKEVWAKNYAAFKALNLGIGGDRTQHVLWRLEHGNIDTIKPRAAVLMIGTNNVPGQDNTAEQIAQGVAAIIKQLQSKLPDTRILLLAIFPREEKPGDLRQKISKVNEIISKLDDGRKVFYLDIGKKFIDDQAMISKDIMPDFLHLSPKGYEIWADAIKEKLEKVMKPEAAGG